MTLLAIITWLVRWTLLSIAIGGVFGWLNYRRHLHSTHNPSRQDGEGETGFRIDHHGASISAISEV